MPAKRTTLAALAAIAILAPLASAQSLQDRIDHARRADDRSGRQGMLLGALVYTDLTVTFEETPVHVAVRHLNALLPVSLVGHFGSPRVDGIDPDIPISLDVTETAALTVLELILEQCSADGEESTWQLRRGFIEIGTKERLAARRETRYYPIDDLLFAIPQFENAPAVDIDAALNQGAGAGGGGGAGGFSGGGGGGGGGGSGGEIIGNPGPESDRGSREERAEKVAELILDTVEPGTWTIEGGDWASIRYHEGMLVVRAPDFMHRQINGYPFAIRRPTKAIGRRTVSFAEGRTGVSGP